MPLEWDMYIHGADHVERSLIASGEKALDTLNIMTMITVDMLRIEKALFLSGGRRGGGSWKRLAMNTVLRKGNAKILITEGAKPYYSRIEGELSSNTLMKSLTEVDAPYSIQEVSNDTIAFGTTRPAAGVIGEFRPFIKFMPEDTARWTNWLAEHVLAPFIKEEFGR